MLLIITTTTAILQLLLPLLQVLHATTCNNDNNSNNNNNNYNNNNNDYNDIYRFNTLGSDRSDHHIFKKTSFYTRRYLFIQVYLKQVMREDWGMWDTNEADNLYHLLGYDRPS